MPDCFYYLDGIRHDIKASNDFPPSVRISDTGEIYIPLKQHRICRNLKKLLVAWKRIADELNIKWFLNGGSLLGTLRDQGLIFYDNDIDLVVQMDDYDKLLNYERPDGLMLSQSEAGFNLSRMKTRFPFIDIWVIGCDKSDVSKMRACGPVLNGKPAYYYTNVWPNEWYYKADLKRLKRAWFEGIEVFIPANADTIVKRMYGENCFVEYRMESHIEEHQLSTVLHVENRLKIVMLVKMMNKLLGLDRTRNVDGHLTCLMAKITAELTAVSSSQTHARTATHVLDYLRTNALDAWPVELA